MELTRVMTTEQATARPAATREGMLAAIEDEHERVVKVMQHNAFSLPEARAHADKSVAPLRAMVDRLDGVELTASEWHTMQWFIGWDANEDIASIFAKLRSAVSS